MELNLLRINNINLKTGLSSIIYYMNTRLSSFKRNKEVLPFDVIPSWTV